MLRLIYYTHLQWACQQCQWSIFEQKIPMTKIYSWRLNKFSLNSQKGFWLPLINFKVSTNDMFNNHLIRLSFQNFLTWGWSPKFATGLNVVISIEQKIYEWPDCSFVKMMYSSFWQKESLPTLILFELCLLWYLAQSR